MRESKPAVPADLRGLARHGEWTITTAGVCRGYLQTNVLILPEADAADFRSYCLQNPQPMPLIEQSASGVPDQFRVAVGADIRTDIPRYYVYRDGVVATEERDVSELWRDDLVTFLMGCSFSAEDALLAAGVRLRHLELDQGVPMFRTQVPCAPAGRFRGPLVVSMRPIHRDQVDLAVQATSRFPLAHGAPVHVGDPLELGIADIMSPDWGAILEVQADEVPVFWACGVTPQAAVAEVRPAFAIGHKPGHMFLTDAHDEQTRDQQPVFAENVVGAGNR